MSNAIFKYQIKPNTPDSHQTSPYWLVAFVRFALRDIYNRDQRDPGTVSWLRLNPNEVIRESSNFLVVENDCVQWQTSTSKASHVSNAQMHFEHSETDYQKLLAPDDWVFLWAFDNKIDYEEVLALVKAKKRANRHNQGLKFVGRLQAISKNMSIGHNGERLIAYDVSAVGFSEFDSDIYYNELVARQYHTVVQWMPDFAVAVNEFINDGNIDATDAIPKLMNICLGLGPGVNTREGPDDTTPASPNDAYLVPETAARLLLAPPSDPNFVQLKPVASTFADLVKTFIGVQRFSGSSAATFVERINTDLYSGYVPDHSAPTNKVFTSPVKLTGSFDPVPLHIKGSVWSILQTFLNDPINEMYTCLRVDDEGYIVPTLVVRQTPFSSNAFINANEVGTAFTTLPRWEVDLSMVRQITTGRSNSPRFNYVQLLIRSPLGNATSRGQVIGFGYAPPLADQGDITRAGLRKYQAQIAASVIVQNDDVGHETGNQWTRLMADVLFGGHLKLGGTVILEGIQAPICEGDNVVVDGVIYHIERVIHQGSRSGHGHKDFTTTLNVSSGISVDSDAQDETVYVDGSISPKSNFREVIQDVDLADTQGFGINTDRE